MKKIIILILFTLLLGGCYDYVEINDLAFISAIGIDYENDEYVVTFEILSDKKSGENNGTKVASDISGRGKSIAESFDNITMKIEKIPYYHHLKAIVISKKVANNHFQEIVDFLVRSPEARNEFFLAIASDDLAKDIISSHNENVPVIGDEITKLIETDYYHFNTAYSKSFEDILEKLLNDKMDAITTSIYIDEKESLAIKGIALFKGYKYKTTLNGDESAILNILNNEKVNYLITKEYEKKPVSIRVYQGKTNYDFNKDKVSIDIKLTAEVMENTPNYDLREEKTYEMLDKDMSKVLKKEIQNVLHKLQEEKIDALGLNSLQFKKTRKDNQDLIKKATFDVNVSLKINRKGLIFKVDDE